MQSLLGTSSAEIVTDKNVFDVVTEIVNHTDQEEPFLVTDLGDIVYKYKLWKQKLPRIEPFYAIKCNDVPAVLHILAALGTGFDCASKAEIENVLSIGVEPSRILYANPCKTCSFIKYAANVGVDLMTFDNEMELHKVKIMHPDAKLVIRIRVDDSRAICRLGLKFGCDIEEVRHLLEVAKELDLNVVGVSFHVGSGCQDSSAYRSAVASCRHVFDIASDVGYNMELLDIGGGFPGSKRPFISFDEIANAVNQALYEHFPPKCGVKIIAEPGRYFVTSAFTLCANIIAKRNVISEENNEPYCMYYVNDGVYGTFNCLIFKHAEVEVQPIPLIDLENRPVIKSSVWGPTCDSVDCIMQTCHLPLMNVGEWLMFEDMGAYTVSAASTFNGFQKPIIKYILPVLALTYLQKFPNWSNLLEAFGDQALNFSNADISSDCESITNANDVCFLPHPESASA